MTPHSERDEYAFTMDSKLSPIKTVRVRPVVPLKYTQNRKIKSSISVPANNDSVVPAVESSGATATASVESMSIPIEEAAQHEQPSLSEEPQSDAAASAASNLSEASVGPENGAATDSASLSPPTSTQTEVATSAGTQPESKKEDQEQDIVTTPSSESPQETGQIQQTSESAPDAAKIAMHPPPVSHAPMPPPGFHQIPTKFNYPLAHDSNDLPVNGRDASNLPTPSSVQGSFQNGTTSSPSDALVNAPAFVPGHSHHASTSNTPLTLTAPQSVFPPPGFEARPPLPMMNDSAFPPFDARASGNFNNDMVAVNGHSHPGSRAMSHSSRGHADVISPQEEAFRNSFSHNGMPSQDFTNGRLRNGSLPIPPMMTPVMQQSDPTIDSALMIREYLLSQFGLPDLADYILQVFRGEERLLSIPIHSLLAVRSPTLHKLISTLRYANDGSRHLKLDVTDRNFVEQAFIEALQFVYGAPLALAFIGLANRVLPFNTRDLNGDNTKFARQVLNHALSLISSGLSLQLEPVVLQGADIAKCLVRWDTLETALNFILTDGLPRGWRRQEASSDSERLEGISVLGDSVKSQLLGAVIDYLAINFPHHFDFNTSASQLDECPRLPTVLDTKPSVSNHRLSRIQFGQLPAEQPDFVTATLSSILLTLPNEPLNALFAHPALLSRGKGFSLGTIVQTVVAERENRRNRVLEGKRISPRGGGALWEATQWQESVITNPNDLGRIMIICRRVEK